MARWIILTAGAVFLAAAPASAQPPVPGGVGGTPRPTFSPYLNLVRPGGSAVQNYYGLVRPEVQARQSLQNLQGSVALNQQAIGDVQAGINEIPVTGHQASFLNHGRYFLTGGAGGASTSPGGSARPPANRGGTAPRR